MNHLRLAWSTGVHAVQAQAGPDGRQAAKLLFAGKAVAAINPFGFGSGEQKRDVISTLGVTGGEDFASDGFAQDPFQGGVAAAPKVGGDTRPVKMHIQGKGRGRCVICEAALLAANLRQGHVATTKFYRYGHQQVLCGAKFLEILRKEPVSLVIALGTQGETPQHRIVKNGFGRSLLC